MHGTGQLIGPASMRPADRICNAGVAGGLLARVSQQNNYRVEATLSDFHARLLAPVQPVRVERNGQVLPGRVNTILPEIQNGTV